MRDVELSLRQDMHLMEAESVRLREQSSLLSNALESLRKQLATEEDRSTKLFEVIESLQSDSAQIKSDVQLIQDELTNGSSKRQVDQELLEAKVRIETRVPARGTLRLAGVMSVLSRAPTDPSHHATGRTGSPESSREPAAVHRPVAPRH
jgi:septal ring factor EnvC (AmiA/AmiB activator)